MAPTIVLFAVYLILRIIGKTRRPCPTWLQGRGPQALALAAMLAFTGVSHFFMVDSMAAMIPPIGLPAQPLVILSGFAELALAFGLTRPHLRTLAGYASVALFIMVFPANVYAAWAEVGPGGHTAGLVYLWFRGPLQLLFIAWAAGIARGTKEN